MTKKPINIAIVTPHFYPENFIINDIAKKFSDIGRNITVITGLPNYPGGEIYKGYEKIKNLKQSKIKNIKILRFPVIPRKKGTSLNLLMNYFSFLFNGIYFLKNFLKTSKFQHIFVFGVTPITSAILGIYIKRKLNIKLTLWVQDLWPESVQMSGHINNKFLIFLIKLLVKYIYKRCDNIIVQSNSFKKRLKKYTNKKIQIVENFSFSKNLKRKKIPKKLSKILKQNKCFAYAGNIGTVQSVETIIQSAKLLKDEKNIAFIIIGGGTNLKKIKSLSKQNKLKNVFFFGPYNVSLVYEILKKTYGQILTLKKNKFLSLYIPQKFSMYLMVQRPILICASGEVVKLVNKHKVGYTCLPQNSRNLSANISKVLKLNENALKKISKNCKKLFDEKFDLTKQTYKLLSIIDRKC